MEFCYWAGIVGSGGKIGVLGMNYVFERQFHAS